MGCMDIAINICWRLHNCGRWGGGGGGMMFASWQVSVSGRGKCVVVLAT